MCFTMVERHFKNSRIFELVKRNWVSKIAALIRSNRTKIQFEQNNIELGKRRLIVWRW